MKIVYGADHAGVDLKTVLMEALTGTGHSVIDVGANTGESVDYPDFAHLAAQKIQSGHADFGVLVCGSGIGMSIAANRHHDIRAALCHTPESVILTRQHNDANILCLSGRNLTTDQAIHLQHLFLTTEFDGGRHQRRIDKIEEYTKQG